MKLQRTKGNFPGQFSAKRFRDSRSELNMSSLQLTDLALYLGASSDLRAARSMKAWGLQRERKMTGCPVKQSWALKPCREGQERSRRCVQRMWLHHQVCSKMTFLSDTGCYQGRGRVCHLLTGELWIYCVPSFRSFPSFVKVGVGSKPPWNTVRFK